MPTHTPPANPSSQSVPVLGRYTAADLVTGILSGNSACEHELYVRYQSGLIVMLDKRTGDRARAEDLAQDTLLKVIMRLRSKGIDHPERLDGFVYQTAKCVYLGWLRQSATKTERFATDSELVTDERDPETIRIRAQQIEITRAVINELKMERDREILIRYYVSDQQKQEVCTALDITHGHFDRIIHRARNRFRELLLARRDDLEVHIS